MFGNIGREDTGGKDVGNLAIKSLDGVVDNSQALEFDKIDLFLKRRNLSLKGDDSLLQSGDGSSVEIAINLQDLSI